VRVRSRILPLLVCGWTALWSSEAHADPSSELAWLPGDARHISRFSSASRDTATSEVIILPRFSVTLGSEFGLCAWHRPDFTLRAGVFALFGLESRTRSKRLFPAPGGDSNLWRGILGYEFAVSFDRLASEALGRQGALEVALGYYHESDHHTASNTPVEAGAEPDNPDLRDRPQVGNYLAADFAARFRVHALELVLRHQSKLFVNGHATRSAPFRAGTGDELVLQLREVSPSVIPFWSTSVEILLGKDRAPSRYFRSLLGVALPGRQGELRIYASYDTGAQRGLLIPEQQTAFGLGLRYSPFGSDSP
jgi:hypothetical protein